MKSFKTFLFSAALLLPLAFVSCKKEESARIKAVRTFADNVLNKGADRWSGRHTPLLADGINLENNEPLEYVYDGSIGIQGEGGPANKWIMHNLASQQNLFRTFVALSNLTGDTKYREAAVKEIKFHFDSLKSPCGLIRWGGHQIIDLRTMKPIGHSWRTDIHVHELKDVFPYYELMWDVDKDATRKYIEAFWNAHIIDWGKLEFNRHGSFGKSMGKLWKSNYLNPEPFFPTNVLTFLNTGSDMIYSGAVLSLLSNEEDPLRWSKLLAGQYVKARNPKTGLGAYQYGEQIRYKDPPEGPLTGTLTWTNYGDRAQNQFGKDFPEVAREPWALFDGGMYTIPALIQLELADRLGERGREFLEWTIQGIKAYAKYAYNSQDNTFKPLWADGTDLTGYVFPRTGYYGKEGKTLKPFRADELYLFTYARAYRITKDKELWPMIRSIMKGLNFGDPGDNGLNPSLNMNTDNSTANALFALLEINRATGDPAYLTLAEVVGNNILKRSFHQGYFLSNSEDRKAVFNVVEPFALLSLEAALQGKPDLVPLFSGGMNHMDLKTE